MGRERAQDVGFWGGRVFPARWAHKAEMARRLKRLMHGAIESARGNRVPRLPQRWRPPLASKKVAPTVGLSIRNLPRSEATRSHVVRHSLVVICVA